FLYHHPLAVLSSSLLAILTTPPSPTPFPYTTLFRSCTYLISGLKDYNVIPYQKSRIYGTDLSLPDHIGLRRIQHVHLFQDILRQDRKSTRLNSSPVSISYAAFCSKKNTIPHSSFYYT